MTITKVCSVVGCKNPIRDKLASRKPTAWLCTKHYKEYKTGFMLEINIPDNLSSHYRGLKSLKDRRDALHRTKTR